jgi:tripartite-type tricarboxylate transporter receptor subunit TctC
MKIIRNLAIEVCAALAVLLMAMASTDAYAQSASAYPNKPIRLIVPIAAGSVTDVVMRAAAQELAPRLGQQLIIDNKPGASGAIGAEACAKSAPDGYTLCTVYHSIMSYNPLTFEKLSYDPQKDFAPITRLFFVVEGLVVPSTLPVASVAELKAYAQKNPKGVGFGTLGEGSLQDLMVVWLNSQWQSNIAAIPYKGGGPIATAVASNEIQMAQMGVGNFVGLIDSGQIRPLAVSSDKRSPLLPNVPTATEAGLGGFASRTWWGLTAPTGTPSAIVDKLNTEFVRVFNDPKFNEFLAGRYVESAADTPQEFAEFLKQDRETAIALVKLAQLPKR